MTIFVLQREGRDLAAILRAIPEENGIHVYCSSKPFGWDVLRPDLILTEQCALARELLEELLVHGTPHPRPPIWIISPETSPDELLALIRTKILVHRVWA